MHPQHTARRDFFLIIVASVLWGTVGVANQAIYAYSTTNALSLAFARLAIATPLFALAAWRVHGRKFWRIRPRDLGVMLLMGVLQALYQASYSAAIPYAGVTVTTLIALCGAPIMVVVFSTCVLHERLKPLVLVAFIGALGGTILLVLGRVHLGTATVSLPGVLLSLLAAAGYAGFILCGRLVARDYHPLQVNAVAFGMGALLLLCFAPVTGLVLVYPGWGWLLLLYLGCVPTALAYGLFQAGIRSISATVVSLVTLVEPFTAAVLAWLLFQETLNLFGMLGAGLLLGSLVVILLSGAK